MTQKNAKWLPIVSTGIGILMALVLAELILNQFQQQLTHNGHLDKGLFKYSRQLGWQMTPLWYGEQTHLDYKVHYQIGKDGFRYDPQQKKTADWLVFGDSFTFGVGVKDNQTFLHQLNKTTKQTWKNLAVAGYSTDQEYLLFKSYPKNKAQNILFIIYLGNDLADNLLPSPLQANLQKPYFNLENQQLKLNNMPVPLKPKNQQKMTLNELVFIQSPPPFYQKLALYQWLKGAGLIKSDFSEKQLSQSFLQGMTLFKTLLKQIKQTANQQDLKFNMVLLSGASIVNNPYSKSAQWQQWQAQKIMAMGQQLEIPILNLIPIFQQTKQQPLYFSNEGHLTPQGHLFVAQEIQIFFRIPQK